MAASVTQPQCVLTEEERIDQENTQHLINILTEAKTFPTKAEDEKKLSVIRNLEELASHWIRTESKYHSHDGQELPNANGKILTFGSFRIGVHGRGGDVDALLIAPSFVTMDDFFNSFLNLLRFDRRISDCVDLPGAYVPVIKMKFDGIEIDLLFASLQVMELPQHLDLNDASWLDGQDEITLRSLNGVRVTEAILGQLPNIENFKLTLRLVKLWAKKNGIYSNVLGYLGGVAWSILVARVCQLFPYAMPAVLFERFFMVYIFWKWPKPIMMKNVEMLELGVRNWDPDTYYGDRFHLMPIITPCYPRQNTTYNVNASTYQTVIRAFMQGVETVCKIKENQAEWKDLFEPQNFFDEYKQFIAVVATANTEDDLSQWRGLVESRLRHLVLAVHTEPNIKIAHINPHVFRPTKNSVCSADNTICWLIGIQYKVETGQRVNLKMHSDSFVHDVMGFAKHIERLRPGMQVEAKVFNKSNLWKLLPNERIEDDTVHTIQTIITTGNRGNKRSTNDLGWNDGGTTYKRAKW